MLDLRLLSASDLPSHRDEMLDVYRDAYADKIANAFFAEQRYWDRVEAYAEREGFGLVMGYVRGEGLVGYALGYPLPASSRWWAGLVTPVEPSLTEETGRRTFALNYVMTRRAYRRRGIARALHDALMHSRTEERATLLVLPDNVAAVSAYRAWGWEKIGELRPFDDAPKYDAMILKLAD
ncbi:MAG: GNAT family N-acetyltransferase [Hamadaea sp.]|nr:GNAT family N-acetyltransferase [Hamadaea sp.]